MPSLYRNAFREALIYEATPDQKPIWKPLCMKDLSLYLEKKSLLEGSVWKRFLYEMTFIHKGVPYDKPLFIKEVLSRSLYL